MKGPAGDVVAVVGATAAAGGVAITVTAGDIALIITAFTGLAALVWRIYRHLSEQRKNRDGTSCKESND